MGDPLPAIPGIEYWRNEGMLPPAGYDFEWPGLANSISIIYKKINGNDIGLFRIDGSYERILQNCIVAATRSSIRLTISNTISG